MKRVPAEMTERARALRRDATPAERALSLRLRGLRPRFTRQLVIGNYIADLACRDVMLIVELDGSQHFDSAGDAVRTSWLEAQGWVVLRFWNNAVMANPDGCALAVMARVEALRATHP